MQTFKSQQREIIKNFGDMLQFSYDLQLVNRFAKKSPQKLVKGAEGLYAVQVEELCQNVLALGSKIIFVAGPSSGGKTTSSYKIKEYFRKKGISAHVISMDDFFVNKEDTPLLPDGSYDFENVTAVDIPYFKKFLKDILDGKTAKLPYYDFKLGKRTTISSLTLKPNQKLIIEGLHALNPIFHKGLPKKSFYKVYVAVASNFTIGDNVVIDAKNLRLMRRLLRDYYKRGTAVETTIEMWRKIGEGEAKYILPFRENADFILNTTHLYEPLLYDRYLKPFLMGVKIKEIEEINYIFTKTGALDVCYVPKNSLIREFLP